MFGWTEIFITYSQDDYFKVRAQLDAAGISARSRVRTLARRAASVIG